MPFFKSRGPSKGRSSGSGGSNRSGSGGGGGGGRPGGRGGRPGGKPGGRPGGKPFGKKKASKKKRFSKKAAKKATVPNIENTGMEGLYFRDLMEAEQLVHVKLTNGEEVSGYVRYYDKDVISIGPSDGSPKMFVRKDGIRYLYEIEEE